MTWPIAVVCLGALASITVLVYQRQAKTVSSKGLDQGTEKRLIELERQLKALNMRNL